MTDTFTRLTDEQLAFYHRNGYLALDAITTPDEIALLRGVYDRLFAERVGWEEGAMFDLGGAEEDGKPAVLPQLHWPSKYAPELSDTLHRRNALAIARQLLGPLAEPQFEHMILKPGHYGAPTPWHQDEAYWDEGLEYNALSIWMPLEDATVENGCMHFVPGTNTLGVLPHHSISNDPRIHGLEIDTIDVSSEVACPSRPVARPSTRHARSTTQART